MVVLDDIQTRSWQAEDRGWQIASVLVVPAETELAKISLPSRHVPSLISIINRKSDLKTIQAGQERQAINPKGRSNRISGKCVLQVSSMD